MVLANTAAMELGLVRGAARPDGRAAMAAERVRATGEVLHVDLSLLRCGVRPGRGPTAVLGEVRPLGDGFTVIDASDQSDAVRLEATRRDFVANVSHELKTPVGAMALLAEAVLHATDDPPEVRRFATKIFNEANRLGALVTELIALSRLQGAERLPEMGTVEVDEVVCEALARCRLAAESANICITVDPPSGLLLKGDATLLVTALSNLLDNAVSYSPEGSPVSVSRGRVSDVGRSPSPTAAWASPRNIRNASSSGSFGSIRRAADPPVEPGWGWRSSNTSPPTMAVRSRYGASPAPAPPSLCGSPPIPTAHNTHRARHPHPSTRQSRHDSAPPLRIFPGEIPVYAGRNSLTHRISWYHYELT